MILHDESIIEPTLRELKKNFQTHKTKSVPFRKQQLRQLMFGIQELKHEFFLALQKDLCYQDEFAFQMQQINIMVDTVKHYIAHVEEYAKIRRVSTNLLAGPGKSYIVPDPLGVALIIGAWNYPYKIALEQVACCIAAGNAIVLKPSEMAPQSSSVMAKLFNNYLDKNFYRVIEGGLEVAVNITKHPFDLIIFTGSPEKGKLVAKAAADNLIPCILELGGKCPVIVDGTNDLAMVARRIASVKNFNLGQTCVAPDYILVNSEVRDQFIEQLKIVFKLFFTEQPDQILNRFINEFHAKRVSSYLDNCGGKIVYGGKSNVKDKFVEPTIVLNPSKDSDLMKNEIFGPILPVVEYKNIDEAINHVNSNHKPLALYFFGSNESNKQRVINETQSGGVCVNDCMFHSINPELPFGGVGNSGYGYLNGRIGFDNCVHLKSVLEKNQADLMQQRYPPFNESKKRFLNFAVKYGHLKQENVLISLVLIIISLLLLSGLFVGYVFNNQLCPYMPKSFTPLCLNNIQAAHNLDNHNLDKAYFSNLKDPLLDQQLENITLDQTNCQELNNQETVVNDHLENNKEKDINHVDNLIQDDALQNGVKQNKGNDL